jgi:hypothetical protein
VEYPEKRRHTRLPVLIDCRVEGASGRVETRMTDLSPVGCFVDTMIPFSANTEVTLYATLNGVEVPLSGRVIPMKQSGFGIGVEFTGLDEATRKMLEAYIREREST